MAGEKISQALEQELDKVERMCLRTLQMKSFQCASECCKDKQISHEGLQRCLEGCMNPVVKAQEATASEVNELQERLNRCALQCQDEVKDVLSSNPSPEQQEKAKNKAEACLLKCEESHIKLVPKLVERLKSSMNCK